MQQQNKYFHCYSINLFRKIKASGLKYISKGVNPNTNKTFWVFEKDEKLKKILSQWE
jgi:hypothetical protein